MSKERLRPAHSEIRHSQCTAIAFAKVATEVDLAKRHIPVSAPPAHAIDLASTGPSRVLCFQALATALRLRLATLRPLHRATGRKKAVVIRAKILLWIIGPVATIVLSFAVPLLAFGQIESDGKVVGQFLGSFMASVIGSAIWTAYLNRSERVRATYVDHTPS